MECRPVVFRKPWPYNSSKRCEDTFTAVREAATGTQTGSVWLKMEHWPSAARIWWQWQQGKVIFIKSASVFAHFLIVFTDEDLICHLSCWFGTTPHWVQCRHTWITWLQWKPLPGPLTSMAFWPLEVELQTVVLDFGTLWHHSRCSVWTPVLRSAT